MVGITGHHIEPGTRPEDVGGLSKIGLSICFASLLAAIQFGIAGWYLTEGLDTDSRYIAAAVTAFIGSLIVLIIDRNFIYAADTRADIGGMLTYFYLAIRIFLIVSISSLSSQFILPLLLKSELAIHVQDIKDERYDTAKERYTNKYEVKDKLDSEQGISSQISKLKTEIANIPPALVRQKSAADQCRAEYKRKINTSIGPDLDEEDIVNLYAKDKIQCEHLEATYKEAYRAYLQPKQAALAGKEEAYQVAREDLTQAQTALKTDLHRTDENNQTHLNIASADVMWSLIRTNPGARMKYLMITVVQLVLELMPLLLKSLLGRSALGIRIAMRSQEMQHEYEETEHAYGLHSINRNGKATKAKNEQAKIDLTDQIAIQKMKNELNTLKAQSRKTYFDFSPNTQYRTQYANGFGDGYGNPYASANSGPHWNSQASGQPNFQAKATKNEADAKKPVTESSNDKPNPLTDGFYAMSWMCHLSSSFWC